MLVFHAFQKNIYQNWISFDRFCINIFSPLIFFLFWYISKTAEPIIIKFGTPTAEEVADK